MVTVPIQYKPLVTFMSDGTVARIFVIREHAKKGPNRGRAWHELYSEPGDDAEVGL